MVKIKEWDITIKKICDGFVVNGSTYAKDISEVVDEIISLLKREE